MDAEEMRRHLTSGAAPTGGSGPAADVTPTMQALSVVSTDVGRLEQNLTSLKGTVDAGQATQTATAQAVAKLAEKVTELGEAVEQLGEEEAPTPPPQPWDWAAMGWEEQTHALATLAAWVESDLVRWWPRVTAADTGLPPCWVKHPDMCRSLSLLFVSYEQAYRHPGRRVHHEVDFRRCLDDMLRDIAAAADAYGCYAKTGDGRHHVVDHTVRSDRPAVLDHIQQIVLEQMYEADRRGEAEEVARLMDLYKITPHQLRTRAMVAFTECLNGLKNSGLSAGARSSLVREAGRLLRDYEVVSIRADGTSTNTLVWAPQLQDVLSLLHQQDRALFGEVAPKYEPLMRKYATIKENLAALAEASPSPQAQQLMREYGITREDVQIVRDQSYR